MRRERIAQPARAADGCIASSNSFTALGSEPSLALASHAKRRGLKALFGDVLVQNRRMLVLMRGLGGLARPHPDGPQLTRVVFKLD